MKYYVCNHIGFFLLAIFLILYGLTMLIPAIAIPNAVFGVLAIVAGIFILINK